MANETTCLKCGAPLAADARQGFCPKCLFAQASTGEFDNASGAGQPALPNALTAEESSPIAHGSPSLTVGQEFPRTFGDYELLEEVARGGMGIVYRARQGSLGRIVAVKMLLFGPLSSPEFVKRFRAEASAAASLQHPNIVAIHEVGVHQGQQYFAMDYVEGQSLAKLLANGPLPARNAASHLKTIAEAIHYAHQRGILHRDLKPSNVLIDADDQPRVTDFGLARRLEGDSELTVTGQVLGSPNYMPPEQATATRGKVSRRSDVYSLGAMLYHVLTGRPPFVGEALTDTLEQVLNREPVSPRLLNPSVPRDLETICLKCLEKEPDKRYATALALAEELGRFLNHEPVHARPVARAGRAWRWCRREPALAGLGVALLLVFALGLVGVFWQWRRAERNATQEANERERAEQESLKARQYSYASDMNRAQQAVQADEFDRALQLLDRHRPTAKSAIRNPKSEMDLRGWEWRYLWGQCQGEQRFILGEHANGASAVGMLADGETAFSAGSDKFVRLWDLESRSQIGLLPHSEAVIGAAASPDGRWLATVTSHDTKGQPVLLWDLATQMLPATLTTNFWLHESSITFSPDSRWLAFATRAGGVRIWDVDARSEITNLPAFHTSHEPLGVAFSADSCTLAYNENENGAILLWDIASRSMIGGLTGHRDFVSALAFSHDGRTLASGSHDRTARLWNLAERREVFQFTNHSGGFMSLAFSPDGRTLALGGAGGSGRVIRLVEVATGNKKAEMRGHLKDIYSLALTPDGQRLLSAGEDGTIRVWDLGLQMKEKSAYEFNRDSISTAWRPYGPALCLSTDGRHLLAVYTNQTYGLWETLRLAEGNRYPLPLTNTTFAAVASGGRLAAFGSRSGELMLWDIARGQPRFVLRPGTNQIHRLAFSLDGRYLAAADNTKTPSEMAGSNDQTSIVRVWDVGSEKQTHIFSTDGEFPVSLTFSADARALMAGFWNRSVKLWQLDRPRRTATFLEHSWPVEGGLALLPDGQTIISAGGTDIRYWDVETGHQTHKFISRAGLFSDVALSADGRRLAAGASDGRITIWDVASHEEVATLEGHRDWVMKLAFTPDGDHLVSVSKDQLRVWRAAPSEKTDAPR